jgi:MFS family permease
MVVVICGCAIATLAFGPRSSLGIFMTPLSMTNGWSLGIFSTALAIQNLLWGLCQPITGGLSDKYGAPRVLGVGAVLYAAGLILTAHAS